MAHLIISVRAKDLELGYNILIEVKELILLKIHHEFIFVNQGLLSWVRLRWNADTFAGRVVKILELAYYRTCQMVGKAQLTRLECVQKKLNKKLVMLIGDELSLKKPKKRELSLCVEKKCQLSLMLNEGKKQEVEFLAHKLQKEKPRQVF